MILSIMKGFFTLALLFALSYGAFFLLDTEGEIILTFLEKEIRLSLLSGAIIVVSFVVVSLIFLYVWGLFSAVLKFLLGDETAISRYFERSRKINSYRLLTSAIISVAEGDKEKSLVYSEKAKKLLKNDSLVTLVSAQIQEASGHYGRAMELYKDLIKNKETRSVALNGLVSGKMLSGDNDVALKLAQKNAELNPKNLNVLNVLYEIQINEKDWDGARKTLLKKQRIERLPRDIVSRKEAVLLFAEAKERRLSGHTDQALLLARDAVRRAPSLVAAVCFVSELEILDGKKAKAVKTLKLGWSAFQHPDIAEVFASVEPGETSEQRFNRFKVFLKDSKKSVEAAILRAHLNISIENFPEAKRELALVEAEDDSRIFALLALTERGLGSAASVINDLLSKAVLAKSPPEWSCGNCNNKGLWEPMCKKCKAFDAYQWKASPKQNRGPYGNKDFYPILNEANLYSKIESKKSLESFAMVKNQNESEGKEVEKTKKKKDKKVVDGENDMVKGARQII